MGALERYTSNPFSIYLAVDGSDHSYAAAQWVNDLPLPPGSQVTLLSVLAPGQLPDRAVLTDAQDHIKSLLSRKNIRITKRLLYGPPSQTLVDFADQQPPDLMIVGAEGSHARPGILIGRVTQEVVEHISCPVLVVRAPYLGMCRILLAIDGSSYSQGSVGYLRRFPLPMQVKVRIIHVLQPLPALEHYLRGELAKASKVTPFTLSPEANETILQAVSEELEGRALLIETLQYLQSHGIHSDAILMRGDATDRILEEIMPQPVDLVVTGSGGRSTEKGRRLGSVARKLVYYSGVSVMIVKGQTRIH